MNKKTLFPIVWFLFYLPASFGQKSHVAKGSLFIIGGGKRSQQLMQTMLQTAKLKKTDYIVLLPMATEEPDSAWYYFKFR